MFYGFVIDSASSPQKQLPLPKGLDAEDARVSLTRAVLVGGKEDAETRLYVSVGDSQRVAVTTLRAKERPMDELELQLDLAMPFTLSVEGPGKVHLSGVVDDVFSDMEGDDDAGSDIISDGKALRRRASSSTSEGESDAEGGDGVKSGEPDDSSDPEDVPSPSSRAFKRGKREEEASSGSSSEEESAPVGKKTEKIFTGGKAMLDAAFAEEDGAEASSDEDGGSDGEDGGHGVGSSSSDDEDDKAKKPKGPVKFVGKANQRTSSDKSKAVSPSSASEKKRPVSDLQASPPAKKEKKVEFAASTSSAASSGSSSGAESQLKETVVTYLKKNGACTIGQLGAKVPKPPALKNVKWGQFLKKFACFKIDGQNVTLVN